jgi:hypothetical protein
MTPKKIYVVGGGTRQYLDGSHLYLGSKAMGNTARTLVQLCQEQQANMDVELVLTNMADPCSAIDTNEDLKQLALSLVKNSQTKIVFWTPSVLDFLGTIERFEEDRGRLKSALSPQRMLTLSPAEKLVERFRKGPQGRKDIFLVAFKQTVGASEAEQYTQALLMMKRTGANLVLANDADSGLNMVVTPEEATYAVTTDRDESLRELVDIAYERSHLTFTNSVVVGGEPVPWRSSLVPPALRTVVDHCVQQGAYRVVNGATAGHFAAKLSDSEFLTSRRKTNFNDLEAVGLVRVRTDGPDSVIAYGSKPSVGGQSQRIVFGQHPELDCIVHFHCPMKPGSQVPIVSQREYECGSHQCGQNTAGGLTQFGNLKAVYLDNHGPNIVFHHDVDPAEVIAFIDANFDLSKKSGGYELAA